MAKKAASGTKKTEKSPTKEHKQVVVTAKASDSRPATVTSKEGRSFLSRLNQMPIIASAIAEFVGTFILAAIILTQQNQPVPVLFALVGIILIVGGISGGHVNPAITIGAWVMRKLDSTRAIAYLAAQVLGALLAFVVLSAFVSQAPEVSSQAALFGQAPAELYNISISTDTAQWTILFAELLGATILSFAYGSALQKGRERIVSAFTIGAGAFIALVISSVAAGWIGESTILNPAAAISLQAVNDLSTIWPILIYIVTPAVGGVVGFALFDMLRSAEE